MKALRYFGPREIRYESMDDPTPKDRGDAIIKVEACAICGSDLHIYHGHGFSNDLGFCVGHEAVGEVVEAGSAVSQLKVGDRVMIPASVGCGACRQCLSGVVNLCEQGKAACYGLSAELQGSQAEAVRVPAADFNAVKIPEGISDEQALLLTDNLATAWFGVRNAGVMPGNSVAIVGLGPIGLMAVDSALVMGAHVVFAIDPVPERRALAEQAGAIALHPETAIEAVKEATKGRKLDCVVEAVGRDEAVDLALRLVRPRGTVSVIGVQQSRRYAFPLERFFAAGLTFRAGTCSVAEELPALFPLVQSGRLKPEKYVSHRLALSAGAEAYRLFEAREAGALKMVLTP
ncbi:alcohol dehydrogenase family protein [Novosphingobium cyanobacteriorum]|uniref:Alcohol dehydrogenase family protein n=1 Tax=Novosphingobium cyanobacteriorum TaxID=3024215 RepID=A0ABT6CNS0_9SPHN|nr:alcohol dehydrogenase family protein [Novosphingobium cyanobacteriorum]MDF8334893.1 alcohol dehydrogenase family protein [Novosphingobium cyanobacteriorum]